MFETPFLAVLGAACGLFIAGILGLVLYALWFWLDAILHGMLADETPR